MPCNWGIFFGGKLKYGARYLGAFVYRFNRRFHLESITTRLIIAAESIRYDCKIKWIRLKFIRMFSVIIPIPISSHYKLCIFLNFRNGVATSVPSEAGWGLLPPLNYFPYRVKLFSVEAIRCIRGWRTRKLRISFLACPPQEKRFSVRL